MATSVEKMDLKLNEQRCCKSSYHLQLDKFDEDGTMWDITLKSIDGKEIRAHKCVLISKSEYFKMMFNEGFRESTQDVVQIHDIRGDVLETLIKHIYTGSAVQINENNVEEILNGADLLLLKCIREDCITFYLWFLCDENCLRIKDIADSRGIPYLSDKCLNHALRRFTYVIEHRSFLEVDAEQLAILLKSDKLVTTHEEIVYKAVIKWVKHNETERKDLLPDLLGFVRIVFTTKKFLMKEIKLEPLISSSPECMRIFKTVLDYFNYKYGDPVSRVIRNVKPRTFTKEYNTTNVTRLIYYDCLDKSAARKREVSLDLLECFKDFDLVNHHSRTEWNQYMNEDNFLNNNFDDEWVGVLDKSNAKRND